MIESEYLLNLLNLTFNSPAGFFLLVLGLIVKFPIEVFIAITGMAVFKRFENKYRKKRGFT